MSERHPENPKTNYRAPQRDQLLTFNTMLYEYPSVRFASVKAHCVCEKGEVIHLVN
ncbi:hypothetical protein D3C76_1814960 [compost metagenome]